MNTLENEKDKVHILRGLLMSMNIVQQEAKKKLCSFLAEEKVKKTDIFTAIQTFDEIEEKVQQALGVLTSKAPEDGLGIKDQYGVRLYNYIKEV